MIDNRFIHCDVCKTKINLRSQIGYFDIPFNLHCPTCQTHIYGKLIINQEKIGIKLEIDNAYSENNEIDSNETFYSAELSAEFPTKKWIFVAWANIICLHFLETLASTEIT